MKRQDLRQHAAHVGLLACLLCTQQAVAQSEPPSQPAPTAARPAPSVEDKAAADALFDSALKMMQQGNYKEACTKLQKSHALDPAVGTLLNLGRCYREDGRTASAWTTYREAAALARQEGQSDREKLARDEASALESRLIRVRLIVSDEVKALPELAIEQNGQSVSLALVGEALPVNPGLQTVEVKAQGKAGTFKLTAEKEGLTYSLNIDKLSDRTEENGERTQPAEPQADESDDEDDDESTEADSDGPNYIGPIILGASGIVTIGLGTAFAFVAQSHDDNARAICTDITQPCTAEDVEEWNSELTQAKDNAAVAYLGWGLGGAAVVGAVIWWVLQPSASDSSSSESSATNMKMTPLLSESLWGLSAKGTF